MGGACSYVCMPAAGGAANDGGGTLVNSLVAWVGLACAASGMDHTEPDVGLRMD